MAAVTPPAGFLSLPAELHIRIYKYVLAAVPKGPSPDNLAPYAGLLLSCKKVASDFEYEWAKDYNARLQQIIKDTDLRPLPIRQYGHAAHLLILVTRPEQVSQGRKVPDLREMTRSYTMRLCYPTQALSAHGFFGSPQPYHLMDLRPELAYIGVVSRINFRTRKIYCLSRPPLELTSFHLGTLTTLPWEIRLQIAQHMLPENPTTEQLCDALEKWNQSTLMWRHLLDIAGVWRHSRS
jgi:hypothetical protein